MSICLDGISAAVPPPPSSPGGFVLGCSAVALLRHPTLVEIAALLTYWLWGEVFPLLVVLVSQFSNSIPFRPGPGETIWENLLSCL